VSSCKIVGNPVLWRVFMLILKILWMSSVRGTVSKALLMSIVARSVLYADSGMFRTLYMYCVIVVRSVVVECRALKPCCVDDRGMCGVIVLRISLSRILTRLHNKEIGLYDEGSVGVLLGLGMGMILPFFQMCGMLLCTMVEDVGEGPNGYRPKLFQVPIGYAIGACGSCRFGTVLVMLKGGGSVRGLILLCVLSIYLSVGWCGSLDMEE